MNEHLTIEINEKLNFKKVTCIEGHYITNWDRQNILDYTSAKIMFCPISTDLEQFYCVSDEEHNKLMEELENELKKEEENNR